MCEQDLPIIIAFSVAAVDSSVPVTSLGSDNSLKKNIELSFLIAGDWRRRELAKAGEMPQVVLDV